MKEFGLSELAIDNSQLEIKDEDRNHDYLYQMLESVPFLRNEYAHGMAALDNKSLGALRLTAEIINQSFSRNWPAACCGVGLRDEYCGS